MLVLSRKKGEEIVIPELNIVLRVLSIRSGKVRIGIEAPKDTGVYRSELWKAKCESQGGGYRAVA